MIWSKLVLSSENLFHDRIDWKYKRIDGSKNCKKGDIYAE